MSRISSLILLMTVFVWPLNYLLLLPITRQRMRKRKDLTTRSQIDFFHYVHDYEEDWEALLSMLRYTSSSWVVPSMNTTMSSQNWTSGPPSRANVELASAVPSDASRTIQKILMKEGQLKRKKKNDDDRHDRQEAQERFKIYFDQLAWIEQ